MGFYITQKIDPKPRFDLKSRRVKRILEVKNPKQLYGTICTHYLYNFQQQYFWYVFAQNQLFLSEKNKYWKLIVIIEYL